MNPHSLLRRREFLGLLGCGASCLIAKDPFSLGAIWNRLQIADPDRVLVLVQLSGGNDGLSMIVPHADDVYYRVRPATSIGAASVLKLNDYVGLNPKLSDLRPLHEAGQLAVIQGVGYPQPNRSHFESMDIWHSGDLRGRDAGEGWIGRWADAVDDSAFDPNTVVHVGGDKPWSLHARRHAAIAFARPESFAWAGTEDERRAFEMVAESRPGNGRDNAIERIRKSLRDAQVSSASIRDSAARYKPKAKYPTSTLARQLTTIAGLIHGGVRGRVYSVGFGGFDTHQGQRGRHDGLMSTLGGSLAAFLQDLKLQGLDQRVVVVTFSEFGRRVAENGSAGTDHGTAGPMLVLGAPVKGGIYGTHPSLSDTDRGDLKFSTDFRSVYGTLIDKWIGGSSRELLGGPFDPMGFLA